MTLKKNFMSNKKIILYEKIISNKNINFIRKKFIFKKKVRKSESKNVVGIYSFLEQSYEKKKLSKYKNLKFFLSPTTGYTHVDVSYLKENKIKFFYLDSNDKEIKNISSTAELALTIILNSIRNIYKILSDTKKSNFNRYKYNFRQFKNYNVGIIGFGRIGKKVFRYLKTLGFKIIIFDHNLKSFDLNFKKFISTCDILTLHLPYKGKQIFNERNLNLLKKNVKLINTSRGELIDEINLYNFLRKNPKSEYWTDVITKEQIRMRNIKLEKKFQKLNKLKNFFYTPHIGGASIDAMEEVEKYVFTKLEYTIK